MAPITKRMVLKTASKRVGVPPTGGRHSTVYPQELRAMANIAKLVQQAEGLLSQAVQEYGRTFNDDPVDLLKMLQETHRFVEGNLTRKVDMYLRYVKDE